MSPPPISVLTTQTAFTDKQNISFVGPHHLPKILEQKTTTKMTFYEKPKTVMTKCMQCKHEALFTHDEIQPDI